MVWSEDFWNQRGGEILLGRLHMPLRQLEVRLAHLVAVMVRVGRNLEIWAHGVFSFFFVTFDVMYCICIQKFLPILNICGIFV